MLIAPVVQPWEKAKVEDPKGEVFCKSGTDASKMLLSPYAGDSEALWSGKKKKIIR